MPDILKPLRGPLTTSPIEPFARAVPAVVYMAVIFFASSVPGDEIPILLDDRVAHFVEYFILGGLLLFAVTAFAVGTRPAVSVAILAFVALYAFTDELHQSYVPGRQTSVKDWAFDMLGAAAAIVVLRRLAAVREAR